MQPFVVMPGQICTNRVRGGRRRRIVVRRHGSSPKAQTRKNVRWHVLRVCGIRCCSGVDRCRTQRQMRETRGIVAVNNVVQHAWVSRLSRVNPIQESRRFVLMAVALVARVRRRKQ